MNQFTKKTKNIKEMLGVKYGIMTVTGFSHIRAGQGAFWHCKCECGKLKTISGKHLRKTKPNSCGCQTKRKIGVTGKTWGDPRKRKNGLQTRTYRTWCAMRARCMNPNVKMFNRYGGRGIRVCERWNDFSNFFKDMGERPLECGIDRIDNNGNYEPNNCRWATASQQARNNSRTRMLTFDGKTMCIKDWSIHIGISYLALTYRLRAGWSMNKALTQPVRHKSN
jgi:hypothetical protein